MNIEITARHFDLTPQLKQSIEKEVMGLTKYFENIISAEVILDVEKYRQTVEIKARVYNAVITAKGDSNDMYASIEMAVDKVKSQLKKHKGKLKEKRPEKIDATVKKVTKPHTNEDEVDV
jgi:putative sigma-54 modulation protein